MSDSILTSTKKILGLDEGYTAFDLDVTTHINSVFLTLNQLGVGPADGFMIEDVNATWVDYLGSDKKNLNAVKTYVYLRVRLLFDPPATSYLITAMQEQIRELEWRLNVDTEKVLVTEYVGADVFIWKISTDGKFPPEAKSGDIGVDSSGTLWRKV